MADPELEEAGSHARDASSDAGSATAPDASTKKKTDAVDSAPSQSDHAGAVGDDAGWGSRADAAAANKAATVDRKPAAQSAKTDDAGEDFAEMGCLDEADAGSPPLTCPRTQSCASASPAPAQIRVASWNIKVGAVRGLSSVADVLREIDADVVLLQEVDVDAQRSGNIDQVQALSDELGYQGAFAPTVTEDGLYGIAVLSRLAFRSVSRAPLSNMYAKEPRAAIAAEFCLGEAETLRIINHHADYTRAGAEQSVTELVDFVTESEVATLFAGDFNQEPSARGPQACVRAGLRDVLAEFDPAPTFGDRRIDYIFANARAASMVENGWVLATDVSDHDLVGVDLHVR